MALGLSALLVVGTLAGASGAAAEPAGATFVDLGSAAAYSVLGGAGVANTGAGTVLAGNVGLSPTGTITGFPPGTTAGVINDKNAAAEQAQADRQTAYDAAAAQTSTTTFAGDQAGKTFKPGVHTSAAAFTNTGTMTLDADGDSSAVFVFQIGAALSSAAASKVVLTDGALANNVYWQVAGAASLGAGAKFVGTFLGAGAVAFGEGASLKGRVLTPGTVALTNSPITEPVDDLTAPVVTITGGATRSTRDTTPAITGTTDEPAGKRVTVTVAGQTLTALVGANGAWGVGTTAMGEGPHPVVASVTDASQNTGTADQTLTVDVTAPVVTIDGLASQATKDRTPAISGTSDTPANSAVTVTVGTQTRSATVTDGGTWSVELASLTESSHLVVATADDAAHNTGTAYQILTVDVTLPVLAIDGGATRTTNDLAPWLSGTTAEPAGTKVRVTVEGQVLIATVLSGGTWSVAATTLSDGPHTVVATIVDAARNTGTASQTLTVDGAGETYRPDAAIRLVDGTFVGTGIYEPAEQTVTKSLSGADRTATYVVRVTNRGDEADRMSLRGTPRNANFQAVYMAGPQDVTSAVTAGTYTSRALEPGQSLGLVVKVTRTAASVAGDTRTFVVRASSALAPSRTDAVKAVVKVAP